MGEPAKMHTEDLALFTLPPVNVAEDEIQWVRHLPVYGNDGRGTVKFHISGNGNQYTHLGRSLLKIVAKITDKDGKDIYTVDEGGNETKGSTFVDNVLHTLWSQVDIKFNETLVSTSGTNYPYKAYIENLLTYSSSTTKYQLDMQGFTGNQGNFDATNPRKPPTNKGLNTRADWFKAINTIYTDNEQIEGLEQEVDKDDNDDDDDDEVVIKKPKFNKDELWSRTTCVEFSGPLLSDICNQPHAIINGVDIDITLEPTKSSFRLMTHPEGTEAEVRIMGIYMDVAKIKVRSENVLAIENTLKSRPASYPMIRTDIRTFEIAAGSYSVMKEDIFQGEVPTQLVVGMVDTNAYHGDFSKNPFRFKPNNIAQCGFTVDNRPLPHAPFKFDPKDCRYLDGLESLYRLTGKLLEDTSLGINRDTYRQGYWLMGFAVDPTTSPDFHYLGKQLCGVTRLSIDFHKPLTDTVTLIVYATFPEVMQIDQTRLVYLREKNKKLQRLQSGQGVACPI